MRIVLGALVLLAIAIGYVWTTVPINVPWKGMLQGMGLLPGWVAVERVSAELIDSRLVTAPGYGVSLFADDIADARMLRVTPSGDVLVATPRDGRIILLEADHNDDGVADGRRVLLEGLRRPNGLDLAGGFLYVGEEDAIGRVAFDAASGSVTGAYHQIVTGLPVGGNHWKKTIRFGPDGLLYVALGSSCNVCIEEDARRAAILRYTADGEFVDVFATGLRNSAGFDWSSGKLYATDNGRDLLGDDFPPCELNAVVEGGFYGWPFANGAKLPDPGFGRGHAAAIDASIAPIHEFRAHNSPLGIVFLKHHNHPEGYRGAAIVALHGSWNRREKDGYKVVSLHFGADGRIEERDFLAGFLNNGQVIGRPAEVAEGPDGSVYVSDDYGSAIYRIRYGVASDPTRAAPARTFSAGYAPGLISPDERAHAMTAGAAVLAREGCLVCHAESTTAPAQVVLTDLALRYTLEEMAAYLATPRSPMPPYEADDAQRRALAIYLLETY
jgi:glucose/arabinose dehydrogenase